MQFSKVVVVVVGGVSRSMCLIKEKHRLVEVKPISVDYATNARPA
jgi:hypothetical protein